MAAHLMEQAVLSTGSFCRYVILEGPQSSMELKKIWVHLYGVWTFKNDLNILERNQWNSYVKFKNKIKLIFKELKT